MVTVAVRADAGMLAMKVVLTGGSLRSKGSCDLQAKMIPLSGVTGSCCSLMVTVPLDGLVQSRVRGWPAVTVRVLDP